MNRARVTCAGRRYEYATVEVDLKGSVEEACERAREICLNEEDWDLGERDGTVFVDRVEICDEAGTAQGEATVPSRLLEEPGTHPRREGTMEVRIKVLDERLGGEWPMPRYESEGAAAMDVRACIDTPLVLAPGESAMVSAGFAMHIADPNVAAVLLPRSGLATREGVVLANLVGLVDSDYQGPVTIAVWNRGTKTVEIAPGARIAQLAWIPVKRVRLETTTGFDPSERGTGGFGHTGTA